jgi:hypothetical protein
LEGAPKFGRIQGAKVIVETHELQTTHRATLQTQPEGIADGKDMKDKEDEEGGKNINVREPLSTRGRGRSGRSQESPGFNCT